MIPQTLAIPYPPHALEPFVDETVVEARLLRACRALERLRKQLGPRAAHETLEDLILGADGELRELATEVWNYSFSADSLAPGADGAPDGMLRDVLEQRFGSWDAFRAKLVEAVEAASGEGWVWLLRDKYGRLRIEADPEAEHPLRREYVPLLALDVRQPQDAAAPSDTPFAERLIDWDLVSERLGLVTEAEQTARDDAEREADDWEDDDDAFRLVPDQD